MKVLTQNGFKEFTGVLEHSNKLLKKIEFVDNTSIKATDDHRFFDGESWIQVQDLSPNMNLGNKQIATISNHGYETVYDLFNVEDTHSYYTNDILSHNCDNIFCDEFAHLSPNLAEEFIASVFPTLSSSETSKLIIVSTPKGLNHYYKIWDEAEKGINGFATVSAEWYENPNRNEKWYNDQLAELGQLKFNQEVLCDFLQSGNTLVSIPKLRAQARKQAFSNSIQIKGFAQFELPKKDTPYVMTVDTSRGKDLDYSAFVVFDITQLPYKIVCRFRDNSIQPLAYPDLICRIATLYNKAFVLIETNDLGQQVADILFYDLEYENVYVSKKDDIKEGGTGTGITPGFRTTKKSKSVGCRMLADLVDNDNLIVNDEVIMNELTTFVRSGSTYKGEDGTHDDLAMCLVFFGYLTSLPVFSTLFDFNLRQALVKSQLDEMEAQMLPLGYYDNGVDLVTTDDLLEEQKSKYNTLDNNCLWEVVD